MNSFIILCVAIAIVGMVYRNLPPRMSARTKRNARMELKFGVWDYMLESAAGTPGERTQRDIDIINGEIRSRQSVPVRLAGLTANFDEWKEQLEDQEDNQEVQMEVVLRREAAQAGAYAELLKDLTAE